MIKWLKFFTLGFFSNRLSREGRKRGFSNFFIGFILALAFMWAGAFGADVLPFASHYDNSPDFSATAHAVFANTDQNKRITVDIDGDKLKATTHGGDYSPALLVDTFNNQAHLQDYSVNGYNVVIDTRSADTIAEVEAYCISNDGKQTKISYEDYLTLSDVAKLNFEFRLKYTGNALVLDDDLILDCKAYIEQLGKEKTDTLQKITEEYNQNKIDKVQYDRAVYQLYFTEYYPPILEYETNSKVPLLRNYYFHEYINNGVEKYLFVFDDYMAGSFYTQSGIGTFFYGFYNDVKDGALILDGVDEQTAKDSVDGFIKKAFLSTSPLSVYVYVMNIIRLIPFIAFMPIVVALLAHSVLKLKNVITIRTYGETFKIVSNYVWFSGLLSAVLTVALSFFVKRGVLNVLPFVIFFVILTIRAFIFVPAEIKKDRLLLEQIQQNERTEV